MSQDQTTPKMPRIHKSKINRQATTQDDCTGPEDFYTKAYVKRMVNMLFEDNYHLPLAAGLDQSELERIKRIEQLVCRIVAVDVKDFLDTYFENIKTDLMPSLIKSYHPISIESQEQEQENFDQIF